jgi:hypothetical protein
MQNTHSSAHAQAVLHLCDTLTAAGHTVISANTDEQALPQIFAQSETGELAFFFARADAPEPDAETLARFRALAEKHHVAAYYAAVALTPAPQCLALRPL